MKLGLYLSTQLNKDKLSSNHSDLLDFLSDPIKVSPTPAFFGFFPLFGRTIEKGNQQIDTYMDTFVGEKGL